jgi:hypothetical protein
MEILFVSSVLLIVQTAQQLLTAMNAHLRISYYLEDHLAVLILVQLENLGIFLLFQKYAQIVLLDVYNVLALSVVISVKLTRFGTLLRIHVLIQVALKVSSSMVLYARTVWKIAKNALVELIVWIAIHHFLLTIVQVATILVLTNISVKLPLRVPIIAHLVCLENSLMVLRAIHRVHQPILGTQQQMNANCAIMIV